MIPTFARAALAALAGAAVGAAILVAAFRWSPALTLPLDRPVARVLGGFHPPERDGETTFAWTSAASAMELPGLDRRVPWRCAIRVRGARPPGVEQPAIVASVDGVVARSLGGSNTYADLDVDVPVRDRDGLTIGLAVSPTFVPGPGDRRQLGAQVDSIRCEPAAGGVLPPRAALVAVAAGGALFAAAFALIGAPLWAAVAGALPVAAAQAVAVAAGPALYTPHVDRLPWLAAWPAIGVVATALAASMLGRGLTPWARAALAILGAALYLLTLGLLHPSKAIVDAQFHAHRLQWVQEGRYFFTQPMPSGVSFPYAIALYVASLPFTALTRDYASLLRIVVCAAHAAVGLMLYAAIARRWNDRAAGAAAAGLWCLIPQWFVVVGNANLTNAFGQSVATATLLAAAMLPLRIRDVWQIAALFVLASAGFLSHVGTFPMLGLTLVLAAGCCWWLGAAPDRAAGRIIAAVTLAAALTAVVTYYGRFAEVYKTLDRVVNRGAATAPREGVNREAQAVAAPPPRGGPTPGTGQRMLTAGEVGLRAVGWPTALLAMVGAVAVVSGRRKDRLSLVLAAWFAGGAAFLAFGVFAPVEDAFYRYTVEFIGRVYYATWPAAVVLAGAGVSWAWRAHLLSRLAAAALLVAAVAVGGGRWLAWFR